MSIIVNRMVGPSDQAVRTPAVAGQFYPGDRESCLRLAAEYVGSGNFDNQISSQPSSSPVVTQAIGGLLPHAGWICSGAIAGQTIAAIRHELGDTPPDVVVVFGAVHTPLPIDHVALDTHREWVVPTGASSQPEALWSHLVEQPSGVFVPDERFHREEHAVEVELPLIQAAWPGVEMLPVEIPLMDDADRIGRIVARQVAKMYRRPVFLASSDLTHYGPNYGFTPSGVGPEALAWAKDNDRRLLELVTDMRVEAIVPAVRTHRNACGGGAIAAMLAACSELGATSASVLRHANSSETLAMVRPVAETNAVGYASVLVR